MTGQTLSIDDTNAIPDFFSFNLSPQKMLKENGQVVLDSDLRPIYLTNDQGEPIDDNGNVLDFPDMSHGAREELSGKRRYFEIDTERSDQTLTVSGDGTTRFNVYYKRKEITQRFFFARKTDDGKYQIPGYTKAFSTRDGTLDNHLSNSWGANTDWMELSDNRPQIAAQHADRLEVKEYYSASNHATYYYYELKTKYYANMRDNWLEDAFDPLLITKNKESGVQGDDYALFGAWSVEWGTPYAKKANKTVKGIYEKLDEQLLYTDEYLNKSYGAEATVLNYLSFWANAKNKSWNKKKTFYNFTYQNYVELLPSEYTADGEWNNTGGYTDVYKDTATGKLYGLLPENIIETYDGGDQYSNPSTRDQKVKENQTAAALTGFALLSDAEIEASALPRNPVCSWYAKNGFDGDHHADIKFFYRRRYYSLNFINNNIKEPHERTRNIYYQMNINSVGIRGNWVYFEPEYPDEDMRDYYYFDGWYFDEEHTQKISVIENDPAYNGRTHFNSDFTMPPDDITLYAKWVLVQENISFYHDYDALVFGAEPLNTCVVDYNERILTSDVPSTEEVPGVPYLETPEGAAFAGWYYLNENNTPVRFDPSSMPVTHGMKLYAHWSSDSTAAYQVSYVEKGTGVEVAPPTNGVSFVHQTKSFRAKTGSQLNEAHQTGEGENLWRPLTASHSIYITSNEPGQTYAPNTYAFEYIQKQNVWYRVRYIDAQTKKELLPSAEINTGQAVVTVSAAYIEGYIADSVTKTAVLAASEQENAEEAKNEELAANTIVFLYNANDRDVLYRVDHYVQATDGTGYELFREDTATAELHSTLSLTEVYDNSETARSLTASGYSFASDKTTVNGEPAYDETVEVDENQLIISFYYDRNKYAYKVQYVDYEDDAVLKTTVYNGEGQLQPVGKTIVISPEQHFDYVPSEGADPIVYTRISDRTLTMLIHPDDNTDPAVNVIKVYYRRDDKRLLSFEVSCDHETDDHYADVSASHQIVGNQSEITPVTAIPYPLEDHAYTFLGWYTVPHPAATDVPLSTALTFTPELPGADMTYYAVFRQEQVMMQLEVMYNDTGVYDNTAQADTDGSVTGHLAVFEAPQNYAAGSETPLNRQANFIAKLSPTDDSVCLYEFAGWYHENNSGEIVLDETATAKQIELPMTASHHYIAMFKKITQIPCKLIFRFIPRVANSDTKEDGYNEYVIQKTLYADDFADCIESDADGLRLTREFIIGEAPYESNHGETFRWNDRNIDQYNDGGTLVATVTADQQKEKATVTYTLEPGGVATSFQTAVGSNRRTDPQLEALDVRGKTVGGKYFTCWEIRNDKNELVARCYEPWFSFRIWENYTITPVFDSETEDAPASPSEPAIELIKLDNSRNRWTDDEGNLRENAYSDYLYADFEIAYEGPDVYSDPSYRAGVVFEVCGKYDDAPDSALWDYPTDEANLKEAVRTKTGGNSSYVYDVVDGEEKTRTIQINPIANEDLSTRSRAQYGKVFRNVISGKTGLPTNGNYIFKVYAFLVKGDQVTLSNPVYTSLHEEAVRDWLFEKLETP